MKNIKLLTTILIILVFVLWGLWLYIKQLDMSTIAGFNYPEISNVEVYSLNTPGNQPRVYRFMIPRNDNFPLQLCTFIAGTDKGGLSCTFDILSTQINPNSEKSND